LLSLSDHITTAAELFHLIQVDHSPGTVKILRHSHLFIALLPKRHLYPKLGLFISYL